MKNVKNLNYSKVLTSICLKEFIKLMFIYTQGEKQLLIYIFDAEQSLQETHTAYF